VPDGRFDKYTLSCDCKLHRIVREGRKFRSRKRKVYREMDRLDESAGDRIG
jgi:hypothetical protein